MSKRCTVSTKTVFHCKMSQWDARTLKNESKFTDEVESEPVPILKSLLPVRSKPKLESPQPQKTTGREGYSQLRTWYQSPWGRVSGGGGGGGR